MEDFEIEIMGEKNDVGLKLCKEFLDTIQKFVILQNKAQDETVNANREASMYCNIKILAKEKWA